MKKTILYALICAIAGCFIFTNASAQKSDEAAIKKVLNEETSNYFHKNYDGWANTWVHDTAASVLRASTDGFEQLLGWNAISTEYKNDINGLSERTEDEIKPYLNKTDYHIYINGNMATASFKEGDKNPNTEMRTLVKQNGAWKILNFTLIDDGAYAIKNIISNMRAFEGKWVLDEKGTSDPPNGTVLNSAVFQLRETPIGMEQLSDFVFTANNGQSYAPPTAHEYFIPDYNTNTIKYMVIRENRFGQTFTQSGKITSDKMNSFTVTIMNPARPEMISSQFTVSLENGEWHQVGKHFDDNGKQTNSNTMNFRRL
jgi:hypothetical protein